MVTTFSLWHNVNDIRIWKSHAHTHVTLGCLTVGISIQIQFYWFAANLVDINGIHSPHRQDNIAGDDGSIHSDKIAERKSRKMDSHFHEWIAFATRLTLGSVCVRFYGFGCCGKTSSIWWRIHTDTHAYEIPTQVPFRASIQCRNINFNVKTKKFGIRNKSHGHSLAAAHNCSPTVWAIRFVYLFYFHSNNPFLPLSISHASAFLRLVVP